MRGLKKPLLRGLAGVLPAMLTIFVLVWCYRLLNDYVGAYVNRIIEWVSRGLGCEKHLISLSNWIGCKIGPGLAYGEIVDGNFQFYPLVGLIFAIILVYFVGLVFLSFFGKTLFPHVEKTLLRVPVVRAIYPHAKQLTDFFFAERTLKYRGVVAIEYPRKGIYSLGLLTNAGLKQICEKTGKKMLLIFVPTSPTPITGFTIMVPEDETIVMDLSLEDAFRLIVSGGVIMPPGQMMPGTRAEEIPPVAGADTEYKKEEE